MNTNKYPLITVVTVTFNVRDEIAETLESVAKQTYPNIEYLVIDGNSNDGTQNIIRTFEKTVSYFISEPDNGTYDAMNKAIERASGDWIIFINAGDYFVSNETLSLVFNHEINDEVDFIYGDYIWKGIKGETRIPCRPLELMWQRISFSHQSLLSRTRHMKDKKFDLKYQIVSDYNFYFTCYMEGKKFLKVDLPISVFRAGGISDVHFFRRTYERWRVVTRYMMGFKVHAYYIRLILSHYTKQIFKSN